MDACSARQNWYANNAINQMIIIWFKICVSASTQMTLLWVKIIMGSQYNFGSRKFSNSEKFNAQFTL